MLPSPDVLRLVFMGTATFALPALEALARSRHRIVAVYSPPPRPAGRGWKRRPAPVQARAAELGLPIRTPEDLRQPAEQAAFAELGAELAVVAAYGALLPRPVLAAPRLGCVNLHASLLPRWRGAAPVAHAILAGDAWTGATAMLMDEGLDTGPILAQRRLAVPERATAASLESALARLSAAMLPELLDSLAAGRATARPQDEAGATRAPKLGKRDGRLDWSRPADALDRLIRALNPRPGAFFELDGVPVKVLDAEPVPGGGTPASRPGTVLDADMTVACGTGALRLLALRRAGRGETGGAAFLRGLRRAPGTTGSLRLGD